MAKKQKSSTASARPSASRTARAVPRAIDFGRHLPTVIIRLSNKLRASAKLYFQETFGITVLDWRIIAFLAAEGPSSAYDIWTLGALEKAAVSRALRELVERGFVVIRDDHRSARKRSTVSLSKTGRQLHDQSLGEIVRRHQRLAGSLTQRQIEAFIATAQHLDSRIALLAKDGAQPLSDFLPIKDAYSD